MEVDDFREDRRIVTVLFADLVGSTALTEGLDPEDADDVLGAAIARIVEQVDSLGGTVKDLAGDGVCALFGAPVAHEDDAERAVLCGLGIVDAIGQYAIEVNRTWGYDTFAVRVGIETGRAVLGSRGAGSHVEYGATGDAVNTAARLEAVAAPGEVLVGSATRAMVEERFTWGEARAYPLKGKRLPVEASAAGSFSPRRLPLARLAARAVGREPELERIAGAVRAVTGGGGVAVFIVGEAGVGKSRVLADARAMFERSHPESWLEAGAASYATAVPYLLYRNLVLGWLGLPLNCKRVDVEAAVTARAAALADRPAAALRTIGAHLGGEWPEAADAASLQKLLFAAYIEFFESLSCASPFALALEDLHWADPTSVALTDGLLRLLDRTQLMIFVTARPSSAAIAAVEQLAGTAGRRCIRVGLEPLAREPERELLHDLLGSAKVPGPVEERLLETTDGNPFFIEEQVRAFLDSRTGGRIGEAASSDPASAPVLEPTVERTLIARIDRLAEPDRRILLAAAVLGLRFERAVLQELVGESVSASIRALERADLIETVDAAGAAAGAYRFRHALVQEAAYSSLLRRQLRTRHAQAAAALATVYLGREDEIAATLGHHLAEAGDAEGALRHLGIAARQAVASYANLEAIASARRAIELLAAGTVPPDLRPLVLELLDIEAKALRALTRYDEAVTAYRLSLDLVPADDQLSVARVRIRIAQTLADAHEYELASAELDRVDELLGGVPDSDLGFEVWLAATLARGSVYYWLADQTRYSQLIAAARPIVERRGSREQVIEFLGTVRASLWRRNKFVADDELIRLDRSLFEAEHDSSDEEVRAWAAFHHGFTLVWHRDLDEAESAFRESLAGAERVGSTLVKARSLTYLMVTARLRGDADAAASLVEPVRELAAEVGLPEYDAMALAVSAWAAYGRGDEAGASADATRALDIWAGLPNRYPVDWLACLPLLAAAVSSGRVGEARRWAQAMLEPDQQRLPDSLTSALGDGVRAAAAGEGEMALEHFATAVRAAREQGYL